MLSSRAIRASSIRFAQVRGFHQQTPTAEGFLGKLFGGGKKNKDPEPAQDETISAAVGDTIHDSKLLERELASRLSSGPFELKFPKRQYSAERLSYRVKQVLRGCEVSLDKADWKATSLAEKDTKLKVLSAVMKHVKLPIPSRALNNIHTVDDLLKELSFKPVAKDAGHQVAQFYTENSENLPANMKFEPFAKETRNIHKHQ
ncbi:hypothetical protein GGI15_000882 [Coemansia interrupta]|uniref:Uncharacterized protein n=1 Tax=Coemansia interrupta TaxID=1126814 RepID=A0A9W8LNF9_9FUNG|nr:hypothetical protein GGI15_000882 [Coemansia interrupta]